VSKLRPEFTVSVDGVRVAVDAAWACTVEDQVALKSDTCEVTIDGADKYEWPRVGAELEIHMGYRDDGEELQLMGRFIVDSVRVQGHPRVLSVRAHAGDVATVLSEAHARMWFGATVGQIAADVAEVADIPVRVSAKLRDLPVHFEEQVDESDLELLTRIGRRFNIVAKVLNGSLVLAPRHERESVSGEPLGSVTVYRRDMLSWSVEQHAREKVGVIAGRHRPSNTSGRDVTYVGPGPDVWVRNGTPSEEERGKKPKHVLKKLFASRREFDEAAAAYRQAKEAPQWVLSATVLGDPRLMAETRLSTPDMHPRTPTEYTITKVTHSMGRGGYTTDFEAESVVPK